MLNYYIQVQVAGEAVVCEENNRREANIISAEPDKLPSLDGIHSNELLAMNLVPNASEALAPQIAQSITKPLDIRAKVSVGSKSPVTTGSTEGAARKFITNEDLNNINFPMPTKEDAIFSDSCIEGYINKNTDLSFKLNSEDILNMEIIFDNVAEESTNQCNTTGSTDETTLSAANNSLIFDEPNTADLSTLANIAAYIDKYSESVATQQNRNAMAEHKDICNRIGGVIDCKHEGNSVSSDVQSNQKQAEVYSDRYEECASPASATDDPDDLTSLAESLVVVARQDPNDATKVIHEVFLMSPTTGCLSEDPLDLPAEVIDRIKLSLALQYVVD